MTTRKPFLRAKRPNNNNLARHELLRIFQLFGTMFTPEEHEFAKRMFDARTNGVAPTVQEASRCLIILHAVEARLNRPRRMPL